MMSTIYKGNLILFLILLLTCSSNQTNEIYTVSQVIDGDTVIIDHPRVEKLRYLGINAPENLTDYSPGDPFFSESTRLNEKLVAGKKVRIEYDKEKYDPYGRLLGYVFIDNLFINEELVREGLAWAFFIGPNRKYEKRILAAQMDAQKSGKGIWSNAENFTVPKYNRDFLIKPQHARDYIDHRVSVRGKVVGLSKKNKKVTVLVMEDGLNLIFFNDSLNNFNYFGISPSEYYTGKPVEVTGRVKMYRGKPQIVINHPISIRVMN